MHMHASTARNTRIHNTIATTTNVLPKHISVRHTIYALRGSLQCLHARARIKSQQKCVCV